MSHHNSSDPHLPSETKVNQDNRRQPSSSGKGKGQTSKATDQTTNSEATKPGGSGINKSCHHCCVDEQKMFLDIFKDRQTMKEACDVSNIFGSVRGKGSGKKRGKKSASTPQIFPSQCSNKERKVMTGKKTEQDDEDDEEVESGESEESEEGESSSDEGGNNSEDMDTYFKDIGKMLYYSFFKNMEQNLKSQNLHGKPGKHSKKSHRGKQKAKRKPTTGFDGNASPIESVQQNTYQSGAEGKPGASDLDDLNPSISHKVVNVDQMIAEKSKENNDSSLDTFPGRKQVDEDTDINSLSPSIPHKVIPLNDLIADKTNVSLDTCEIGMGMDGSDQAAHTDGLLHEHSHQARIQGDVPSAGSDKTRSFKDGNTSAGNENSMSDIGQIVEEIQNSGPESRKGLERYFSRGRSQKNLSGYQTQNDNLDSLPTDESLEPSSSVNVGKTSFPNTSENSYTLMGKYAEGNYLEMRLRGALPHKKKILMESLARNADVTGDQFGGDLNGTTTGHYGKNEHQGESYSIGMAGKGNAQQQHISADNSIEKMQRYHKFPAVGEHFQPSVVSNANFSSTSAVSNINNNPRLAFSQRENVSAFLSDEANNEKEKHTAGAAHPEKEVKELEEYLHKESCGSDCLKRLEKIYGKGVKKYIPSPPGKDSTGNGRVIMLGDDGAVVDVTDQEYFNSAHVKTLNDLSRMHYTTAESYENAVSVVRDLLRCNFVKPECLEKLVSVFGSQILENVAKDAQSDEQILTQLTRVSEGDTTEGSKDNVNYTGQHAHQNPQSTFSSYGTVGLPVATDLYDTGVYTSSLTSVEKGNNLQTEGNLNPAAGAEENVRNDDVDELNKYLQEGTYGQKCLKRMEDVYGKGVKSYIPPHPERQMNKQGRVFTLGEDGQVIDVTVEENAAKEDLDNVMNAIFKEHTSKESYDKGISEIKDYLSRNAVLPGCKKRLELIYGKGIIDAFEDEAHLNKVLKAMDENDQNENATCKNSPTCANSESSSATIHSRDQGDVQRNDSLTVDISRTHDSEGVEICMGLLSSLEVSSLGMNEYEAGIDQTRNDHTRNVQSDVSPLSRDVTKPTTGSISQKRRFHQRDTPQRLNSYDSSSDHTVTPLESRTASVSSTNSDFLANSHNQTSLVDNSIATPISSTVRSMPYSQSTDTNSWVFSDNESLQTDSDITDYHPSTGESSSLVTHQSHTASFTSSDSVISQAINFIPPQSSAFYADQQFTTPLTNSELSTTAPFQNVQNSHTVMDTTSSDFDFLLNSPIIPLSPDLKMPNADGTSHQLSLPSTLQSDSLNSKPIEIHTLSNEAMSSIDQNFTSVPNATDVTDNFTIADSSTPFGIAGQTIDTSASHRFGDISSSFQISQPSSTCSTTQITHSNVSEGDENGTTTQSIISPALGTPQRESGGRYFPVTFPLDDHSFQTFTSLNPDSPSFFADTANLPQSPLKVPETLNESNSFISTPTPIQPEVPTSQPSMTYTTLQTKPQNLSEHLSKTVNAPATTTTAGPNQAHGFYASSLLLSLIPKASEATTSSAAPLRVLSANSSTPADAVMDTIQPLHSRKRYSSAGNSSVASPSLAVASTQQTYLPSSAGISISLVTVSKGVTGRNTSSQQERKLPPCRICGEKASGYHFGVNSCEACNEFYRRTLKQNKIYFCARDGNCDVSGAKRNSCSFCRFQRCVKAGMSRDRIKTGRYSHKKRTLDALELKQLDEMNRPSLDANLLDQKIDHLQNLYAGFCTLEKLSEGSTIMDGNPASFGGNSFYDTGHSPAKCPFVENTLPFFFPKSNVEDFVREFLRLTRGIPGFSGLCSQDQTALSRKSWVEFWMLSEFSATSSDIQIPTHPKIILLLSDECKNVLGGEFVRSMTHCCNRTRAMNLSRTIFLLMKVVVVTSPDCVTLVNKNEVENLNWVYVQCLLHELGKPSSQGVFGTEGRSSDHGQMFTEIMDVLNELRTIVRSYEKVLSPTSVQALFQ